MGRLQHALTRLDEHPAFALHRVLVGWLVALGWQALSLDRSGLSLLLLIATALLALRLGPVVVRRLVRFDESVISVWSERRQLAKRFDSYQWQKCLWIGIGVAAQLTASGEASRPPILLAAALIVAGAVGHLRWRRVCQSLNTAGTRSLNTAGTRAEGARAARRAPALDAQAMPVTAPDRDG